MISASDSIKDLLKSTVNISASAGAIIEYNLNTMVDKITASSSGLDHVSSLSNAFKKLFPIDTIYKPWRPVAPGIKYYIYTTETSPGVQTDTPPNSYSSFRDMEAGSPRLYYPGADTTYKYWVGPKNKNVSLSLEYFDNQSIPVAKLVPCNKVIARFETSHDVPTSWTIKGTKSDSTVITLGTGTSLANGEAVVYYNGTAWSKTEPTSYSTTQSFKKISLEAVNSGTGKLIGVIELSPRWVIDISNDIQSFDISKQTSMDQNSMLPVGTLTANMLNININKFSQDSLIIKEYNRDSAIDSSKIYLHKNTIIKPYINIKDGTTDNKIFQGTFYALSWQFNEFGDASISALDSAKILQETMCPLILVQDAPVTSSIKRLLDAIGFSNYRINIRAQDGSIPTIRYFWTSEDKTVWETIQELCRDIQMNASVDENNVLNFYSRDYIYDYNREVDWDFTSETITVNNKTVLPNIISLNKTENSSANSVRILWQAPATSDYDGSSSPIWQSDTSYLGAGSLATPLTELDTTYFNLNSNTIDQKSNVSSFYGFSGYALINGEIIEYDGIEYQYVPKTASDNKALPIVIKSLTDIYKYKTLSKPGYSNTQDPSSSFFKPTGRYKILPISTARPTGGRGALGTTAKAHPVKSTDISKYKINLKSSLDSTYIGNPNQFYNSPTGWAESSISKSFISVSNFDKDKTTFTIGVKEISSIDTSSKYHAFGTRMFFDNNFQDTSEQVGGFSFFTSPNGAYGYYVVLTTTGLAKTSKDIRILKKRANGTVTVLKDTQTNSANTLAGVYSAETYNIDVLVKCTTEKNIITVFVNGFKIQAEDVVSEGQSAVYPPLSPTKNIGIICGQGIAYYDYVYGTAIESGDSPKLDGKPTYKSLVAKSSYQYSGVYSDDTISLLYGDLIYSPGETAESRNGSLLEFGATAREVRKVKVRFQSENPSIPLRVSVGGNKQVTVLDSKIQPFGAEMYVLNNTSTFVPLHDNQFSTFSIIGNEINRSGQIEYSIDDSTEMSSKEPLIFQSTWIQSEQDAKSLATWIKESILNKNKAINLDIFGNPLISPGDIVTINYPLQELITQVGKYIVVDVQLQFSEGVTTRIACRAI